MTDVAVVGGGVIGLAVAWRVAQRGATVVLTDPAPGSGASNVAAGMLAPVAEAQRGEPEVLALGLESWRRYPHFVAELEEVSGQHTGLERSGSLLVARNGDDLRILERELAFRSAEGLRMQRLSSTECRRLSPGLAPSIRAGLSAPDDMQVDPRRLTRALLEACRRSGVEIMRSASSLHVDGGVARGIDIEGRLLACDTVVLAAGVWSARIAGVPQWIAAALRPVKGQILRLHNRGERIATQIIRGVDAYLVERDCGEVVVGATAEERGFDTTATAGAVYELLRAGRELLPDIAELELSEVRAGLRPATRDNAPLLGPTEIPGLLCATGHFRNGILLTPVTADIIAAQICNEDPGLDPTPFSPQRFEHEIVHA